MRASGTLRVATCVDRHALPVGHHLDGFEQARRRPARAQAAQLLLQALQGSLHAALEVGQIELVAHRVCLPIHLPACYPCRRREAEQIPFSLRPAPPLLRRHPLRDGIATGALPHFKA